MSTAAISRVLGCIYGSLQVVDMVDRDLSSRNRAPDPFAASLRSYGANPAIRYRRISTRTNVDHAWCLAMEVGLLDCHSSCRDTADHRIRLDA